MLEIKYNFNPLEHIPLTESLIGILEDDLVVAYEGCTLEFNPDIDWLEDLLLRTYVKLG
jgi:hypothetical protein